MMVKQSPTRNHRSKGIKVKHVLQIFVLIAICFLLIYEVKHSHDKKKAVEEHDAKMSVKTHISNEVLKFGRKDLQPRSEETSMKHAKLDEEAEEETGGGGGEKGNGNEEEEDDNAKGGVDEIDEGDLEKFQLDDEREEDLIDGEKERNTLKAREESYRGDDASSAVTYETQTERGTDNSNENTVTNIIEEEGNKSIKITDLKVERGGMGEDGISPNMTGEGELYNGNRIQQSTRNRQ